jgi:hypothetical protein
MKKTEKKKKKKEKGKKLIWADRAGEAPRAGWILLLQHAVVRNSELR